MLVHAVHGGGNIRNARLDTNMAVGTCSLSIFVYFAISTTVFSVLLLECYETVGNVCKCII